MPGSSDTPPTPTGPEEPQSQPRIGVDEWVATHEERRDRPTGLAGRVRAELDRIPRPGFFVAFGVAAALLPFVTSSDYIVRVGFDTLIYMLLALGLNVVVGYAGLLDLGYIAFFGFGAYTYAMLASSKFGLHWDTLIVVPIVVIATAILGLLVALPSRRLSGDYLAIVTLFFGQLFVTVYLNGNRISVLGITRGYDVTGGPNGIPDVDPWNLAGLEIVTVRGYYYAALVVFLLTLLAVFLAHNSRTGRGWRSLREDSLAAELMGMPVNRLKLMAFVFGAAVAGLTGTLFASLNTAVFAVDFDVPFLIIVYCMLILGGLGSLGGVIVGALVVNVSLELLRTPDHATWVFYLILLVTLLAKLRPWRALVVVLGGTIVLGYVTHAIAAAVWPQGVAGESSVGGWLGNGLEGWALHPTDAQTLGNVAFIVLIGLVLFVTTLHGWRLNIALIPTLYLTTLVWENVLVVSPSVTRLILVGAILITLMNVRPEGLLGTKRVEIV